jgi:hypothetical protein
VERPESPGSDGASPYRPERRFMLKAILLVVVLVLDLFLGVNRSARVAARRAVRTEPLPTIRLKSKPGRLAYNVLDIA